MRHGKKFNHLGRTTPHRKAMLSNMATSLIINKRITTTVAKAKALRKYVEPILTRAKTDTTHSRRMAFSYLRDKHSVTELFNDVADRIATRPGGYTRIIRLGNRLGDNAEMCMMELVDYNENLLKEAKPSQSKTRRGRRAKTKAPETAQTTETPKEEPAEVKDETEELVDETTVAEVVEDEPEVQVPETVEEQGAEAEEISEEVEAEEAPVEVAKEEKTEETKAEPEAEVTQVEDAVEDIKVETVADEVVKEAEAEETITEQDAEVPEVEEKVEEDKDVAGEVVPDDVEAKADEPTAEAETEETESTNGSGADGDEGEQPDPSGQEETKK